MNKREWIRANRDEIDRIIYAQPGMDRDRFKLNDDERSGWPMMKGCTCGRSRKA